MAYMMFLVSLAFVFISSFFYSSIIKTKTLNLSIIYLILIFVSQIILSIEVLSVFKQINAAGILISNSVSLIISSVMWNYYKRPSMDFRQLKSEGKLILNALSKDKTLCILFIYFVFACLISFVSALFIPTNSWDSLAYHLARIGFWIQNQTLAHYDTSSIRQIIFPINSEILMLWPMVFIKRDYFCNMSQYFAYIGNLFILSSFLSYLKLSYRRILWTIFIVGAFPALILEASSVQTNALLAFFLFCSFFLFIYGIKENDKKSTIFSAISFSIALGIKYSAFIFLFVFILYLLLIPTKKEQKTLKILSIFLISVIISFALLGSYNYFLNYLDFGNPFISQSFIIKFQITDVLKSTIANIIRYLLLFIDFSGINQAILLTPFFVNLKTVLFSIFGLSLTDGLAYADITEVITYIHENTTMYGILGLTLMLPLICRYGLLRIWYLKKRSRILSFFALIFIIYLIILSASMKFSLWNNRYLTTGVIIASPILAYSYNRKNNLLKLIIIQLTIIYYLFIPIYRTSQPFLDSAKIFYKNNFNKSRNEIRLRNEFNFSKMSPMGQPIEYLSKIAANNSKIALIYTEDDWYYPYFQQNLTWKIYSKKYIDLIKDKNFNDYDYIIISGNSQTLFMLNDRNITYHYKIIDNKVKFNSNHQNNEIYWYLDNNKKIFDPEKSKGTPTYIDYPIDFTQISANFKLIKTFNKPNPEDKYRIYKKYIN